MVNDATCLYDSSPMNRDGNDWGTVMGYSEQMEGTVRNALEITDEAKVQFRGTSSYARYKDNGFQVNSTQMQWWEMLIILFEFE